MRFLSIAALLCFSAVSCLAAETECYERLYDAVHMQKHKLQEVAQIRLTVAQNGAELKGRIQASFRDFPSFLSSGVTCVINQKTTSCDVDQNGGSFSYVATLKGIKITNRSNIRIGGEDDGVTLGREVEHREFFLFKTYCKI